MGRRSFRLNLPQHDYALYTQPAKNCFGRRIETCTCNIVKFPMPEVYEALGKLGLPSAYPLVNLSILASQ